MMICMGVSRLSRVQGQSTSIIALPTMKLLDVFQMYVPNSFFDNISTKYKKKVRKLISISNDKTSICAFPIDKL